MKLSTTNLLLASFFVALASIAPAQEKSIQPDPPAVQAKYARVKMLTDAAELLVKQGKLEEAFSTFDEACRIGLELPTFGAGARLRYAEALDRSGRLESAIVQYKKVFRWDSANKKIHQGSGFAPEVAMEFALCLAKANMPEEAKAFYHLGLKTYNVEGLRYKEPTPFLVVFADEPEGVAWEYSKENLEAAVSMITLKTAFGTLEGEEVAYNRIRSIAPAWMYPIFWKVAEAGDSAKGRKLIAQCDAMAMSARDRADFERYKIDFAEHLRLNEVNDTHVALDRRPMLVGAQVRSRMTCLQTCVDIVKRFIESD